MTVKKSQKGLVRHEEVETVRDGRVYDTIRDIPGNKVLEDTT